MAKPMLKKTCRFHIYVKSYPSETFWSRLSVQKKLVKIKVMWTGYGVRSFGPLQAALLIELESGSQSQSRLLKEGVCTAD